MLLMILALTVALDPETDEALKVFSRDYGAPTPFVRAVAVTELAKLRNSAIRARLGNLLLADDEVVRIAAAEGLGAFTEERDKVAALLINAVGPNAKLFRAEAAILLALGRLREESALPSLHQAFESRDPKDTDFAVAKAALQAAGLVRCRDSIEPLLDLGKRFDKILKGGGKSSGKGGLGIAGGSPDPQTLRAKALGPLVPKTLQAITGEKWISLAEWKIWWDGHKPTFKADH